MNSEENSTEESIAKHQSKYIQKENYVTALNSEEVLGTPIYTDKAPQLLDKTNSLENPQEPAGSSSSNIQPSNSTSVVSQIVYVPLEERKYLNQFGEGRQAKFFIDIMHRTGANLEELTFIKDQGLYIIVSGKPETVKKAQKEIFAWFHEQDSTAVSAFKEQCCTVIGKTGEKLQNLEENTATNIQILCPDNYQNRIKIAGTKEGIKKYPHEVFTSEEQDKHASERLDMEMLFHPSVARPYNTSVYKVVQEEEARIRIPPPSTNHTEVMFTEKKQQLNQSVAPVKESFEDTKKKNIATAMEMKLQHKCTIGPKINSVQEILERTGVSIEISPSENMSDPETLQGEPESSGKAFTKVCSKSKRYTVSSVSAPSWIHRFIIGKKGQNIATITENRPKVCVEFTGDDKIIIKGPTKDVNYIRDKIEVIVKDLIDRMYYEEINIDYKVHKYLIGKNGVTINQIKEKNKVSVLISPENAKNNLIRIEGEAWGVQQAKRELLELAAHAKNEQSKDLIIEQRFHRTIIGQKGERIRDIRKKFPEVMINFPDLAQKSDIVQLRGPKYELEQCTEYLENVVTDLVENNYSITIPIFKKLHKNIIGKGGANIKKICAASNTKIQLPSAGSNSENIVITGKRENCEVAYNWILSIQKDTANISETEISIPSDLHIALIDPKSCLIGSIVEECGGICMHFPKDNSGLQRVIIKGPAQSVEKAKKKLLQLAEEKESKSYAVVLQVKPQYHKFLMSKNGGNVPKICDETGAHIVFPLPEDENQELITITGIEEAVKDAQKELEALIQNLDSVVEDNILINPKYHRHFIMRRGQVLREITEECGGVIINISCSGKKNNKVTIKGAKPCVEAAKKQIQEIIGDFHTQVTTECVIPQKFHHFVLGPMCSRVRQISRDYNVRIKFPDREENVVTNTEPVVQEGEDKIGKRNTKEGNPIFPRKCDTIYISGRKEKCEAAMEALVALIPVTVEVDVPFDLHRYIIGQKGSGIRKLMEEFEVDIQVSAAELQSSSVSITGLAANVKQAKARLEERVVALQAEIQDRALRNFKLSLTVDPKYHPKIIGQKGLVIAQICLEHEVTIHFPSKESNETQDQIIITGYEKNTIAARDAIMKMVHKFEKTITRKTPLNHRVHGQIIGFRGKAINKIMNQFQVDIRFPPREAPDPNFVTVTGVRDKVTKAIDHILSLEEHYLATAIKHESQQEHMKGVSLCNVSSAVFKSFAAKDAPCTASTSQKIPDMSSSEDFPSLGDQVAPKTLP
ncbi:vigilin-like [Elephas maximus indicus]|uniref:vigilin-like n=1 Tax=Elephas maximus indicus TaxID=99487 RepID=UPI0021161B63|nr:vigilin-like [Elephas maximus indicus]